MRLGAPRPFYGWAIVAAAAVALFASGPGQSFVFAVFVDSIIEDTGLSRTAISGLYSVGTGIGALLVLSVGRLTDRFGARPLLALGGLAMGAACLGLAAADGPGAVFLAFAGLRALGQGALPVIATLLTAQWFVRRRGRAVALTSLGLAAANAVLPPLSRVLIDNIGWRESYVALGVMVWVLVVPAAVLIVRNRPEEMGLHPDGAPFPPASEAEAAGAGGSAAPRRVLSSPMFWLIALPMATPMFAGTAVVFHQTSIFEERGLSATVAATAFVPFAVTSAMFSMLAGVAVERLGPKWVFVIDMALLFGAFVLLRFISSTLSATAYALLLGASVGIYLTLLGTILPHFYGRHGLGRVHGTSVTVGLLGAAVSPLLLAVLQGATGDYKLALWLIAATPVVAAILITFVRPRAGEEVVSGGGGG